MVSIHSKNLTIDFPVSLPRATLADLSSQGSESRFHIENGQGLFRALDGLNLDIQQGERVGIWGKNGAGKTTLLRALRGVYEPRANGSLEVHGETQSFFNLTFGMDENASGWENILLRGVLMGATPKYMREVSEEIAEFSELGAHMDLPVRGYSAGMRLRLAFSIAVSLPADIILMDEWLSVGDVDFRAKAASKLQEVVANSKILVITSHNDKMLEKICTRIIKLEDGRMVDEFETV